MQKFLAQVYRINDVSGWHNRKELVLAPEFQRRSVWSPKGKSFLIDSILRGMPLPQFFIREIVHPREKRTVREVVDGQQRISTILAYMRGEVTVFPTHNELYGRMRYDDLPEEVQRAFLSFPLSVNVLEGTADKDVLEIFSRLNAYTVPLNAQEKLNAKYVGAFKIAMDHLAREHNGFWTRHGILTSQTIARMKDVELTCELVGAMLHGLQNQKKIISDLYRRYDDTFPQFEYIGPRFAETLQLSESLLGGEISGTIYNRSPIFYALFCAIYDCTYGLESGANVGPHSLRGENVQDVRQSLIDLSDAVEEDMLTPPLRDFYRATKESQNKLPQRRQMHDTLVPRLRPAFA
jgi:hypothetical protein